MKKNVFVMSIVALCMFGCSESDDELQLESEFADEMSVFDFEKIHDLIQNGNEKLYEKGVSSKASGESNNNGNGVYIVPFYSKGETIWRAWLPIPETSLLMQIDFPQNGDDRAIVFSENEMMVNFTIQGPRLALRDLANRGRVKYANWCEENKTGMYKMRGRTTYIPIHLDDDGVVDLYFWGPNAEGTVGDKNFLMHVKSTLTNACNDPTEIVDFSYMLQYQNGRLRETATID